MILRGPYELAMHGIQHTLLGFDPVTSHCIKHCFPFLLSLLSLGIHEHIHVTGTSESLLKMELKICFAAEKFLDSCIDFCNTDNEPFEHL